MALPTSGQITLNQIHVEAGGSSGSQASINDSDIRSLIGAVSGQSNLSFSSFYGASAGFSTTMTVGSTTIKGATGRGYSAGNYGSLTNTTFGIGGIYSGKTIRGIIQNNNNSTASFAINTGGVTLGNSGWSTIKINGITLNRSAATFFNNSSLSEWSWPNTSANFLFNNADGTTELVEFT